MKIVEWLRLPGTRAIRDLDDPATTLLHAEIVQKKPFLKQLYLDWYRRLIRSVGKKGEGLIVELGSGGGFIKNEWSEVITSDILPVDRVDKVFSAEDMPFKDSSVEAFVMLNVLHHIKRPRVFFQEAVRCLKVGGKIVMIEPANTVWSRFIYRNFHHENFDPDAGWQIKAEGPLSESNQALAWIIFHRDKEIFESNFPMLQISERTLHTPFRYLFSGGLQLKQLLPTFAYPLVKNLEHILKPFNSIMAMFETVVLQCYGHKNLE
jgi:SAM-dependent methyltransferase